MNSSSFTRFIVFYFSLHCLYTKVITEFWNPVLNLHKFNLIVVDAYRRLSSKIFKFPLIFDSREKIVLKKIRNINLIIHSLIHSCLLTYSSARIHTSSKFTIGKAL